MGGVCKELLCSLSCCDFHTRLLLCTVGGCDAAHVQAMAATATKIRQVDTARRWTSMTPKHKATNASSLRNRGRGPEQEERDSDKDRFIPALIDIMRRSKAFKDDNSKATEEEYGKALESKPPGCVSLQKFLRCTRR